ncbi:MAG: hypothetical protein QG641_1650 [Candidatus Poribacteria bacterium]|nr:hypothetical protein [Candidatus Poribacteria bacterium]
MKLFFSIIFLLIALSAYCAFEGVDPDARSLGMGSALVSVADDANAIFWNTAGITHIDQKELAMSYMELYDLVSYSSLSYVQRVKGSSFGLGVMSSSDTDGIYHEMELILCYAKEAINNLNLGANIKYLSSEAYTGNVKLGNGKGISFDLGCQYHILDDVSLGIRLQNLLGYVSYNRKAVMGVASKKYSQSPDFSYGLGVSVDLERFLPALKNIIVATELADRDFHTGIEYTFHNIISIRSGLRFGNALTRAITAGFGIKASALKLDYAYVSSSVGAQTSQFSVSVSW